MKRKVLCIAFRIGERVRLVHDPEKLDRMITQVFISATSIRYELSIGDKASAHYEMEIERPPDVQQIPGFKIKMP